MESKNTRGGAGRGQGRKKLEGDGAMVPVTIKVTKPQKEKLRRLGNGAWVRDRIDRAKE